VKKILIILTGGIEILDEAEQRRTVKLCKLAFEIAPAWFLLARFFHWPCYLRLMG